MSVSELFNQLNVHVNNSEFEKVYHIGQTMLSKKQLDKDAFKSCIDAIIENDRYSLGQKLLVQLEQKGHSADDLNYLVFEKLYIFYKLNLNDQFEKLFNRLSIDKFPPVLKRSLLHLKAQQFYKLGLYNNALDIYKMLIQHDSQGLHKFDDLDLKINETAIRSQQQLFVTEMKSTTEDAPTDIDNTTSYDLLFNESLIEFNERNFKKALKLLGLAKDKSETFHKNESLLDNFLESGVMYLQIAYIYQLLNDFENADSVLNEFYTKFSGFLSNDTKNNNINVQLLRLIYLNNSYSLKSRNQKFNLYEILKNGNFTNLVSMLNDKNKFLNFQYNLLKRNESIFNFKINKKISITESLNYNNNNNDKDSSSFETFKKSFFLGDAIDDNENYDLTILALASLQESKIKFLDDLNMDESIKDRKLPKLYYRYLIKTLDSLSDIKNNNILDLQKIVAGSLLSIQLLINKDSNDEIRLNSSLNLGIKLLERIIFNEIFFTSKITRKYYGVYSILLSLYEHTLSNEKYQLKFSQIYNLIYDRFFMLPITNKYQYNFLKKITFEMVQLLKPNDIENEEDSQKISQMLKKLSECNSNDTDDELINALLAQMEQKQQEITGKLISIDKLKVDNVEQLISEDTLQKLFDEHTGSLASISSRRIQQIKAKHVRKRKNPQHPSKSDNFDKERWIPLKDRSYYKVSKKDKKKMKNATQGGMVDHITEESGINNIVTPVASSSSSSSKKNKKNKKKAKK